MKEHLRGIGMVGRTCVLAVTTLLAVSPPLLAQEEEQDGRNRRHRRIEILKDGASAL